MNRSRFGKAFSTLALLILLFTTLPTAMAQDPTGKIEPALLDRLAAEGSADLIVRFDEQADLSPAYELAWQERGEFVVKALAQVAQRSQARAQSYLDARGLAYQPFLAGNDLYVWAGDLPAAQVLAELPGVAYVRAPQTVYLDPLPPNTDEAQPEGTVAWGIVDTKADQFWTAFGRQGDGIVVANIDTGVQYNHPALDQSYRCPADPGNPSCWEDPSNICDGTPCDNAGHGTHTMGTMIGDDDPALAYSAGMAPNAHWIACKGCEGWSCSEYALDTCADWLLKPGGDPSNRPHVVNNSWAGSGCESWYLPKVQAWRAAGIFPAFSAGNSGSGCSTIRSPSDYQESFSTAAHSSNRAIASFSSRGPSCFGHEPYTKPNISAPGVSVCSSIPGSKFSCSWSGTSMSSPHTAGAVALLWSCQPALVGQVDATFQALQNAADPPPEGNCGAPPDGEGNYTYGYGYLDVYQAGLTWCGRENGYLNGHIREAGTGNPIDGAEVVAVHQDGQVFTYLTDPNGYYTATALAGTYTVAAYAYGYASAEVAGVEVTTGTLTTQDLTLTAVPSYVVSGTVTDAQAGWPLYAYVTVEGEPVDPPDAASHIWTDPVSGFYSLTLAGAITYTLTAAAWAPSFLPVTHTVGPLTSGQVEGLAVSADATSCLAPGYRPVCSYFQDFEADDGGFKATAVTTTTWEWGIPESGPGRAHSGRKVWATNLDGNYRNDEDGYIESPDISLGGLSGQGLLLSWWQWLLTESGKDYASVEVSRDGGNNWTRVYGEVSGFANTTWGRRQVVLDPSYAVDGFRLRFRLRSAGTGTYPGYYVDDICIRPIGSPTAVFADDLEGGTANWGMNGLWNLEAEGDTCGALAAPFPSPSHDLYYGQDGACTYNTGSTNTGVLSMSLDLDLSAAGAANLTFSSYEETECGGSNCNTGKRYVDISTDGGTSWRAPWASTGPEGSWHQVVVNLSSYVGGPLRVRFRFETDTPQADYLGWMVDNISINGYPSSTAIPCAPQPGGLVVGHVYDANTGGPRDGAHVASDALGWTTVRSTPGDPAVDDALYTLFIPLGSHVLTATVERRYEPTIVTVTALPSDTLGQDFFLPAGILEVSPGTFSVTLGWGMSTSLPLTLANGGALGLEYRFAETLRGRQPAGALLQGAPTALPRPRQEAPDSAGPAPAGAAAPEGSSLAPLSSWPMTGTPALAMDLSGGYLVRFEPQAPVTWERIARRYADIFVAGDFIAGDFATLYTLDYYDEELYAMDTASGVVSSVGPSKPYNGESWTGMTSAPDGTMYASSTSLAHSTLYTMDLATGTPTIVGDITGAPCIIDIAINRDGQMYGVDICDDVLVGIDPATGAATLIGPIGFNANFAQDIEVEEGSGILYMAAFNGDTGHGELRIADTTTGASTLVGMFPGGREVDAMAFATGGTADIPWLSETPVTGTLASGASLSPTILLDAGAVDQPGQYLATLWAINDAPYSPQPIPVTLTVLPAVAMGEIMGYVTDAKTGGPVEATITIAGGSPITWTTSALDTGYYQAWLFSGTYDLTFSAEYYLSQTLTATVVPEQPVKLDVTLMPHWVIYLPLVGKGGGFPLRGGRFPASRGEVSRFAGGGFPLRGVGFPASRGLSRRFSTLGIVCGGLLPPAPPVEEGPAAPLQAFPCIGAIGCTNRA